MNNQQYDFIVVGSGPGGATVARELTARGKKVLILEWGKNTPMNGSLVRFGRSVGMPGKGLMFTDYKGQVMIRGICTGGSSVFYCATAFEPPYEMLRNYGIDIENEVRELKNEIPIAPLKDELIGPGAKKIMESAQDLGYDWHKINKFIFQDKCRLDCQMCSYGCPYGAKWTARNFVEQAMTGGAELVNGARATKILFEGNRAVGVEFRKNFKTRSVYGKNIIVSAGGIGSPVLLRHSGLYGAGYDFFYDPLYMVFGTVDGVRSRGETQMAGGIHVAEDGYVMTDLKAPALIYLPMIAPRLRAHKVFSHSKTLMIMVKIKDDLGGRITWHGGVRKSLSREDKLRLAKGCDNARRILTHAGAKDVFKSWGLAAHPGGTVKINDLVDADLKTRRDNLYVCDCSVIPEAWGLPPTLTLLGLGKRLARHLVEEQGA
jgi:choline dehydrogenase-like flavoprotein